METRSKRRKLMMVSSYVSPRVSDFLVTFESLNDDTQRQILQFVGNKSYATYAGINKQCKEIYVTTKGMSKETYFYGCAPLSLITKKVQSVGRITHKLCEAVVCFDRLDVLYWALEKQNKNLLEAICNLAARKGRIDVLNEVLTNVGSVDQDAAENVSDEMWNCVLTDEDNYKKIIFGGVDSYAACFGKLDVLKWLCTKGFNINKEHCAKVAAREAQLRIIQWLREVKGLQLDGYLHNYAAWGCQLRVLKWLREQEVDWKKKTFRFAAEEGNLDILQWLHNEGCPWPEHRRYCVHVDDVTPEVEDWCRVNTYGNRLDNTDSDPWSDSDDD